MTKDTKSDKDKGLELVWRLKEQPTTEKLRELVKDEIITKDEARDILFNKVDNDERVKSLKEQVEFLEKVVKALSEKGTTINNFPAITYYPKHPVQYWHTTLTGTSGTTYTSGIGIGTSANKVYAFNSTSGAMSLGSGIINC